MGAEARDGRASSGSLALPPAASARPVRIALILGLRFARRFRLARPGDGLERRRGLKPGRPLFTFVTPGAVLPSLGLNRSGSFALCLEPDLALHLLAGRSLRTLTGTATTAAAASPPAWTFAGLRASLFRFCASGVLDGKRGQRLDRFLAVLLGLRCG